MVVLHCVDSIKHASIIENFNSPVLAEGKGYTVSETSTLFST